MIRSEAIKKILEEEVVKTLSTTLSPLGFKYIKSQNGFKRIRDDFTQFILVGQSNSPLVYVENEDKLYVFFSLHSSLQNSKFDNWVTEKLKTKSNFQHSLTSIHSKVEINPDKLDKDYFYEPTKSQAFKNYVLRSMTGGDSNERIHISELPSALSKISMELNNLCNIPTLFENRSKAYRDYYRLLIYNGNIEEAKEHYLKSIKESKQIITDLLKTNLDEAKKSIQSLEFFSEECKILLGFEIKVDFNRSFQKLECKQRRIKLANNLGYEEILSLDTSLLNIESFAIDDKGNTCAIVDRNKIVLISESGQVNNVGTLEYPDSFRTDISGFQLTWNKDADSFIINNYILNDAGLTELPIQVEDKNIKPHSLYPHLSDLVFDKVDRKFYTLFTVDRTKTCLSIYNKNGDLLESSLIVGHCRKINLGRKEILRINKDNYYESLDFKGNLKDKYLLGNGNDRIELSKNGNYMVLHFYSTKSQFYNLDENKNQTLWAHPTYLKDYKEKFYSDINHNFGMTICKFSPNDEILVGGADHGKYVFWDGKGNNRKELIPSEESRIVFNYFQTNFKDGQSFKEYFVPYVESIDSTNFFINRDYKINKIHFIDDNIFLTKIKDAILTWDYRGNSIGYIYGLEKCVFSESNFMAIYQENQLSIFKRKLELDESFKSSIFKEITKNELNSNITNISIAEKEMEESNELPSVKSLETENPKENKQSWFSKFFKIKST